MSFLDRWARLKREAELAKAEAAPAATTPGEGGLPAQALPPTALPAEAEAASEGEAVAAPEMPADAVAAPEGAEAPAEAAPALPRLEDLDLTRDLKPFLQDGVPLTLRNAAMRRMWALDPAIRDYVSEAVEYALDYNTPGAAPGYGPIDPKDVGDIIAKLFGPAPDAQAPVAAADSAADAAERIAAHTRDHTPQGMDDTGEHVDAVTAAPQQSSPERCDDPSGVAQDVEMEAVSKTPEAVKSMAWNGSEKADQSSAFLPQLRRHGGAMPR